MRAIRLAKWKLRHGEPFRLLAAALAAVLAAIWFGAFGQTPALANNCLSAATAPGCLYGLPAEQYQALAAQMAAHPAPPGTPLVVDEDGIRKYTATAGPSPHFPTTFTGVQLAGAPPLQSGWLLKAVRPLTVPGGYPDSAAPTIPRLSRIYIYATLKANGVQWALIGPGQWVNRSIIARLFPAGRPEGVAGRWIAVDVSEQVLTAYQDDTLVFATLISSGKAPRTTRTGLNRIYLRQLTGDMSGGMGTPDAYNIYDVPYVMYFNSGMALHGAPWHNNFGRVMSHGCVNMTMTDAHWLFDWTESVPDAWVYVWRSR